MAEKSLNVAIGLGALAGLRSMSAPALLSAWLAKQNLCPVLPPLLDVLTRREVAELFGLLAVTEMALDKVNKHDRTEPLPLTARLLSGAVVGSALLASQGKSRRSQWEGAAAGGLAAAGAAYGGQWLRRSVSRALHLPSPLIGLLEDLLVLAAGTALLKALKEATHNGTKP